MNNTKINSQKGPLYLMGAFTLAGTSVISARLVSGKLGIFSIAAMSLLFAILGLIAICLKDFIATIRALSLKKWFSLLLQATCGIFLFRIFLLKGLLYTSTGEAGILTGVTPAATAILAWFALKEPITKKGLMGILSTVSGVLLIQGLLLPGLKFSMAHVWGNVLVVCAAICESLFSILSRRAAVRENVCHQKPVNPVVQTALVSLMAFFLCLIPATFEHPVSALKLLSLEEWLSLVWYGLVVTALGFIFWYAGITRCRAYTAAAFSGMMPLVSLLLSIIVLGERYDWSRWSGCILVILGMLFIAGHNASGQKAGSPNDVDRKITQER